MTCSINKSPIKRSQIPAMGKTNFVAQNALMKLIRDGEDIDESTGDPLEPRFVRAKNKPAFDGMTQSRFRNALNRNIDSLLHLEYGKIRNGKSIFPLPY